MSKLDKLLLRFKTRPKDFTYDELTKMLRGLGYKEIKTGKSAGSRVAFKNFETEHILRLHRPHPLPILKEYLLKDIEMQLKSKGVIQ